jgi:hypothetical protein
MQFYGTCPCVTWTHNIQGVSHMLGQVWPKIVGPKSYTIGPSLCMGRANKVYFIF